MKNIKTWYYLAALVVLFCLLVLSVEVQAIESEKEPFVETKVIAAWKFQQFTHNDLNFNALDLVITHLSPEYLEFSGSIIDLNSTVGNPTSGSCFTSGAGFFCSGSSIGLEYLFKVDELQGGVFQVQNYLGEISNTNGRLLELVKLDFI